MTLHRIVNPRLRLGWIAMLWLLGATGCASPYKNAIPAYCYSDYGMETTRDGREPINFLRLRRDPPDAYQLGPRDVLGVYIEGVLGQRDEAPPVHFPEDGNLPPAIGFPVPVREDGTVSLPLVAPIRLEGLTLAQAEQQIRTEYVRNRPILKPENDRIIVTLMRPRTYHVLVVREDTNVAPPQGNKPQQWAQSVALGVTKRGMTHAVELRAYENDVLHALSETGGLPGMDAKNEITILRGAFRDAQQRDEILAGMMGNDLPGGLDDSQHVTRIPLRIGPDQPQIELSQDEITLQTGDVVFVQTRESEVFYTGGLLPAGQFPLPRDYDIDVIEAMAMAGGSVASSAGSNIDAFGGRGGVAVGAIFPPTRVIILRKTNGQHIPIEVDLKRAMVDARERLRIVPGDFITLEYKPLPMFGNLLIGTFRFNYLLNGLN